MSSILIKPSQPKNERMFHFRLPVETMEVLQQYTKANGWSLTKYVRKLLTDVSLELKGEQNGSEEKSS